MSKKLLTEALIGSLQRAQSGQRYVVYDAIVPGFGVRVSDVGGKSYVLVGRLAGGRNPTRRKIGVFGAISLDAARQIARDIYAEISRKKNKRVGISDRGASYNSAAAKAWERHAQQQFIVRLENETKRHCRIGAVKLKEAIFEKASAQ